MENALSTLLLSSNTVYDMVNGRISPALRDDGFPAITYQKTNTVIPTDISGQPTGNNQSQFSIVVHAKSYADARNIGNAIISLLNGFRGAAGDKTVKLTQFLGDGDGQQQDPDITQVYLTYNFIHN
ncbi:tail completion protein gp17 [Neptunicella sp.]|uniref:tail completion protein gp17 n=1 Tax=Neptunicella sp. TaxID=2125986 RepID=UPI003F68DEBE